MLRKRSHSLTGSLIVLGLALPVGAAMAQSSGGGGSGGAGGLGAGASSGAGATSGVGTGSGTATGITTTSPDGAAASSAQTPANDGATAASPGSLTPDGQTVRPDGDTATTANAGATTQTSDPSVVASLAAPGGTPPLAYMTGSVRVSDADMAAFLANPTNLLSLYGEGGLPMSNYVRLLAASDNRAVPTLLTLGANPATTAPQKTAIGSGLARAAIGAQIASPTYAAYIQQQVASSQDPAVIAAFTSTLAEPATAAFGGGGAGGGGAGAGGGSLTGGGEGGTNGGLGNTPVRNLESTSAFNRSAVVSSVGEDGGNGVIYVPFFVTTNDGSPTN